MISANMNIEGGKETVQMIKEAGGEATLVKADVSKAADVEMMINKAVDTYGRLDYAFNNAGITIPGSTIECTEENWERTISVNLKGVWLCMKYEILQMLKSGGGAIVNNSSIGGVLGGRTIAYVASKHGVIGATKVAAVECAESNIRVNAICPGLIRTQMANGFPDEARWLTRCPMKRAGTSEEVAKTVLWLCSNAASYITGHALVIDGGYVVNAY
jgi:NAD(P)-dependent dehydrogenase (short-subunit alcohol dehydrogenase family)